MSRFQKLVKFLSEFYGESEDFCANVGIDLLKNRTFDWRKL